MPGQFHRVLSMEPTRAAPPGLARSDVNWMCVPPDGLRKWTPSATERAQVVKEAKAISDAIAWDKQGDECLGLAGLVAPELPRLKVAVVPAELPANSGGLPGGVHLPVAPVAGLPVVAPGAGPAGSGAAARSEEDIAELMRAVEALEIDIGKDNKNKKDKKFKRSRGGSRRSIPDRKKKDKKKKKKDKRRRHRSRSGSSSRSGRSRSSSDISRSSSSSPE